MSDRPNLNEGHQEICGRELFGIPGAYQKCELVKGHPGDHYDAKTGAWPASAEPKEPTMLTPEVMSDIAADDTDWAPCEDCGDSLRDDPSIMRRPSTDRLLCGDCHENALRALPRTSEAQEEGPWEGLSAEHEPVTRDDLGWKAHVREVAVGHYFSTPTWAWLDWVRSGDDGAIDEDIQFGDVKDLYVVLLDLVKDADRRGYLRALSERSTVIIKVIHVAEWGVLYDGRLWPLDEKGMPATNLDGVHAPTLATDEEIMREAHHRLERTVAAMLLPTTSGKAQP